MCRSRCLASAMETANVRYGHTLIGKIMEIFNVGVLELVLVLLLAFILFGPRGMIKISRDLGRLMHNILHSPLWFSLRKVEREIRQVPTRLIDEAGLEGIVEEMRHLDQTLLPSGPHQSTHSSSPPEQNSGDTTSGSSSTH